MQLLIAHFGHEDDILVFEAKFIWIFWHILLQKMLFLLSALILYTGLHKTPDYTIRYTIDYSHDRLRIVIIESFIFTRLLFLLLL